MIKIVSELEGTSITLQGSDRMICDEIVEGAMAVVKRVSKSMQISLPEATLRLTTSILKSSFRQERRKPPVSWHSQGGITKHLQAYYSIGGKDCQG